MKTPSNISIRLALASIIAAAGISNAAPVTASRSFAAGNSVFGVDGKLDFTENLTNNLYTAQLKGYADGYVLTRRSRLAEGEANVSLDTTSNCRANGFLKVEGATLASWDRSFTASTTWTTAPFIREVAGGSVVNFSIGPVNIVSLGAKASVKVYATGSAAVVAQANARPKITVTGGPVADASATAYAGLNVLLAKVSVTANLTLGGYSLQGSLAYLPQVQSKVSALAVYPLVNYSVTANTRRPMAVW